MGSSGPPSPATAHCYFSHRNLHQGRRCGRIMHPVYLWLVRSKFTRLLRESSGHGSTPARDRVKSCCFFLSPPPPPPPFFFGGGGGGVVLLLFLFCSSESTTCADSLSLLVSQSVCTTGTEVVVHVKDPMRAYYKRKPLYWWHGIHR